MVHNNGEEHRGEEVGGASDADGSYGPVVMMARGEGWVVTVGGYNSSDDGGDDSDDPCVI